MIQDVESDFFQTLLQAGSDIALAIGQGRIRRTARSQRSGKLFRKKATEHWRTPVPTHLNPFRMMPEVIEVEAKLPGLFGANDVAKLVDKPRRSVGRKTHYLTFITVVGESQELSSCGIYNTCGVRILHLAQDLNRISLPNGPHRRDEITKAVDGEQCSTLKWRHKERTGEMSSMVFDVMKMTGQTTLCNPQLPGKFVL